MKKSEFKSLIREEIKNTLNEAGKLKIAGDGSYADPTEVYYDKKSGKVHIKKYHGGGYEITYIRTEDIPKLIAFLQSVQ